MDIDSCCAREPETLTISSVVSVSGVDVLFFKLDGNAQPCQLPQGGEAILGVAGETGDGFHQHPVDPAFPTVGQHTVKILPLVRFRTADRLVGVDIHQLPAVMPADQLGVITDLRGVGQLLLLGIRTDPAVGRHTQGIGLGFFRRYDSDVCHMGFPLS